MKRKRLTEADRQRIATLYALGMPIKQLCEEYGLEPTRLESERLRQLAEARGLHRPRPDPHAYARRYHAAVDRLSAMLEVFREVAGRPPVCLG